MPLLDWNHTDFIECLEVLPKSEDVETEQVFSIQREGLALDVSVWPLESVVYLDLHRVESEQSLIGMALFVRGPVEFIKEKNIECLRFHNAIPVPNRFSYMDFEEDLHDPDAISYGLTAVLRVNPDIVIEFENGID